MEVTITDELGRIINQQFVQKTAEIMQLEIDLSNMNKGMYFLKIQSDQAQFMRRVLKF